MEHEIYSSICGLCRWPPQQVAVDDGKRFLFHEADAVIANEHRRTSEMTEYAHYVSETEVTYPRAEEFRGIPNWLSNDSALRKRGYVPLTEVPEPK